jgi:uncharacterized protein (TIGR00251 family)
MHMGGQATERGYRWDGDDLILETHIQAKAAREAFAGVHNGRLKVLTNAAPAKGQANRRLLAFLAGSFGVAKSCVELLRGETSREKTWRISAPKHLPDFIDRP